MQLWEDKLEPDSKGSRFWRWGACIQEKLDFIGRGYGFWPRFSCLRDISTFTVDSLGESEVFG